MRATHTPGWQGLLVHEGEYWRVSAAGGVFRLKDTKGLRYLSVLLARPGVELHSRELAAPPAGPARPGAVEADLTVSDAGDAGAVLDDQAKRAYRERLAHLREEAEEADAFNDPERAERARSEIEFLGRELAAAVGLGGRDRRAASAGERARLSVTRAIRAAIDRIESHDADLGRYLHASIKTGTFCSFHPVAELESRLAGGGEAPAPARVPGVRLPLPDALASAAPALVGRSASLAELRAWWDELRGAGAMIVTGEPGIGKTRLATELARAVHDAGGATVLYGRCFEHALLPAQPLFEALEHAGRDLERPPGPDAAHAFHYSVKLALEDVARDEPLLLLVDDLHWVDGATEAILAGLAARADAGRVGLLATARRFELGEAGAATRLLAAFARAGRLGEIALLPLPEAAVHELVRGVLQTPVQAELLTAVTGGSAGNPFFASELARHLHETGRNHSRGLPPSIDHVVQGRLGRLGGVTQFVLRAAAVAADPIEAAVVADAIELPLDDVIEAMDEAARAELVREDTDRFGEYTFAHALVRSAILGQLTRGVRLRLHARLGAAIERVHASQLRGHLPALAHHFTSAHEAGDLRKAAEYAEQAADQAHSTLAVKDALAHCRSALAALDRAAPEDAARRVRLLLRLGDLLSTDDDGEAATVAYDQAVAAAAATADQALDRQARIHRLRNQRRWYGMRPADEAEVEAAVADAARDGDLHSLAVALHLSAQLDNEHGDHDSAIKKARRAIALARQTGDSAIEQSARSLVLAAASFGAVPTEEVEADARDVLRWAEGRRPHLEAVAFGEIARAAAMQNRMEEAVAAWRAGGRIIKDFQGALRFGLLAFSAADVEPLAGAPDAAERVFRDAFNRVMRAGNYLVCASLGPILAESLAAMGQHDEGLELTRFAEKHADDRDADAQIRWRIARSAILAALDDLVTAEQLARGAVQIAAGTDFLHHRARAVEALARAVDRSGRAAEAHALREEALALYERKGDLVSCARLDPLVGRVPRLQVVQVDPEPVVRAIVSG